MKASSALLRWPHPNLCRLLALASFGAFLLACRGLLGIDDDARLREGGEDGGPSNEAAAGDGALGPDGLTEGGIGMDGGGGPAVPVDRRYAQWRLPPIMPVLSQYDLQPDTVTDKVTGLVWQRLEANQTTMSFPAGIAYCEDLTIGGQSDWRLPTRIEFLSILDYGRTSGGLLNATVFPNAASASATSGTWTASLSLLRAKLVDHLVVDSFAGNVQVNDIGQSSLIVRCVRGGPTTSPLHRYVLGSGIASDVLTKLTWQLVPMAATRTLADATSACAGLALGGFASGWRLPTVRELASLIDEAREHVPLVASIFGPGPTPIFWSGTQRANSSTDNWTLDDATADIDTEIDTGKLSVRCVR